MTAFIILLLSGFAIALLPAYFPWWTLAVIAFGVGAWLGKIWWHVFLAAFLAAACVWLATAAYFDTLSEGRLSAVIITVFGLSSKTPLFIITTFIGGLTTGMAALTGALLRRNVTT